MVDQQYCIFFLLNKNKKIQINQHVCLIGEDLNSKARNKYQQEQLREWSLEQQNERDQARRNQDQADRLYELKMRELDQRSMELQKAEEDCRRSINMATADYNNALVIELPLLTVTVIVLKHKKYKMSVNINV